MAPNFFSKFTKTNSGSRDGTRSPSPSPTSPPRSHPTISVSRPSSHRPSDSFGSARAASDRDEDTDSINPNVTIVPPSPRNSNMSVSDTSSTRNSANSTEDLQKGLKHKTSRRLQSLSLDSHPMSPLLRDDEATTPTPARPHMSERDDTARPLSHSSSTGNLRGQSQSVKSSHPRSATVATSSKSERQQELHRSSSSVSNKSSKSNRSGLRIKLKNAAGILPDEVKHERVATAPATSDSGGTLAGDDNESVSMSPVVESPTSVGHDTGPFRHTLSASATVPNIPSSALLSAPDNSDAASIHSVSSTKKRRLFRRSSVKEPTSPLSPALTSSQSQGSHKSPKRKNTGLASALAASGLAMANPAVSMPQITPAEILSRDMRSNSLGSNGGIGHRSRASVDRARSPARSRQTSLSYPASDMSDRESFISGMGGGSDDDDIDLDADDIPVTGFAVASARRNQEFHEMFPSVPEGDYLIEDYGCALQREILVQGRLYISENHACFHANIFGWVTDLVIPMYDVTALDKRMTAFVIPNAIQITTRTAKYTFTSFLSRDTTFDVIYNVWRLARPEDSSLGSQLESARASLDANHDSGPAGMVNGKPNAPPRENKITQCACGKAGQHYTETAMESVLPGTPEKIYNLMFTSGFIKEFMRNEQKLTDIQISDWMPLPDNATLLTRNMSYIKPLTASIGPRSTRCELRDETAHCDFDEYVSMLTTTRTPEVPSGGVFSVKTRTCITWASSVSTRIVVTTQVEWTGRSFIKGIIEKSVIDGQKGYHVDLEKAMRDYIHEHKSEFIPEGVDPAVVEEEAEVQSPADGLKTPGTAGELSEEQARKTREIERNQRGLQWAYDTFEGAMKVAQQSTEGALELIRDGWEQSSTGTIQYFVIVVLLISNIWTLMVMGRREEIGRRKEMRRTEEREKWVQGVVTALWDELTTTKAASGGWPSIRPTGGDLKEEILDLNNVLDRVEERVEVLRKSLQELD